MLEVEVKEEQEEETTFYIQKPTVVGPNFLAEEVWNRKNDPRYYVYYWDEDRFEFKDEISLGEVNRKGRQIVYRPVDNDDLRKGLVVVPRRPKESSFKEVTDIAVKFATADCYEATERDKPHIKLLVTVSEGSWFLDRFVEDPTIDIAGAGKFAPIISIRGPSGRGKNRLLTALRLTSYRPYYQVATVRIPSLYRPLDLWRGSLWLDECDHKNTGEKSDFSHYLNSRATGTPISRQNPENPRYATAFYNFGLTGVTQRRPWEDNALEGRSLPYTASFTDKPIPTVETDEMLRTGLDLQDRMLHLRMKNFHKFLIDKTLRIPDISDHRLIASVLPLLSLAKIEPEIGEIVTGIAKEIEKEKVKVKALSTDGFIINLLWEKIEAGLFTKWNNLYYVLDSRIAVPEKKDDKGNVTEKAEIREIALTTTAIAETLGWNSSNWRRVINSLGLSSEEAPSVIRIGKKSVRPIFFTTDRLEILLKDFVVGYQPATLATKVGSSTATLDQYPVTEGTKVTAGTHGGWQDKGNIPPCIGTVTPVTTVTAEDAVKKILIKYRDLGFTLFKEKVEELRGVPYGQEEQAAVSKLRQEGFCEVGKETIRLKEGLKA